MILGWGNYRHEDGEVAVRIVVTPVRSEGNQYYAYDVRWSLFGHLKAATQAALVTAIAALEAAYSTENKDLVLFQTNGVTAAASLLTAGTIGGTRIVSGPTYPEDGQHDAEFSTFRRYQIEIEARRSTGQAELLAWTESLSFHGTGGPKTAHAQPLVGPPQKQQLAQQTPIRVVQQGRAIGFTDWPTPPPPQWPNDVREDEIDIKYNEPKRYGPPGSPTYVEFEVEWTYPHEGVGPFVGRPNLWPT
jgi:hypothetical protein